MPFPLPKNNVKLDVKLVRHIYFCKLHRMFSDKAFRRNLSKMFSSYYRVSRKTIRDIWNQSSWRSITKNCDMSVGNAIDFELGDWEMFCQNPLPSISRIGLC